MPRFEQEWKNPPASTLTAKPPHETTANPTTSLLLEALTPRQNAVIQMQRSRGNAAVRRMLMRTPETIQRFSADDHQNLNDPEPSSEAGAKAIDPNMPLTPPLTPELLQVIESADNGMRKVPPAQETLRRNVHIMRSFVSAKSVNQPLPLPAAGYATISKWSYDALDEILDPIKVAIGSVNEDINQYNSMK